MDDLVEMGFEQRQRHVGRDRLIACVGLAYEKVCAIADVDQRIGPFGVAGKGDHLAFGLEAESETRSGAVVMYDVEWSYAQPADIVVLANLEFRELQREPQVQILRAREASLHEAGKARLEAGRSGDRE